MLYESPLSLQVEADSAIEADEIAHAFVERIRSELGIEKPYSGIEVGFTPSLALRWQQAHDAPLSVVKVDALY